MFWSEVLSGKATRVGNYGERIRLQWMLEGVAFGDETWHCDGIFNVFSGVVGRCCYFVSIPKETRRSCLRSSTGLMKNEHIILHDGL